MDGTLREETSSILKNAANDIILTAAERLKHIVEHLENELANNLEHLIQKANSCDAEKMIYQINAETIRIKRNSQKCKTKKMELIKKKQ